MKSSPHLSLAPLLVCLLLLLCACPLHASTGGGWVTKKGKGFLKLDYRLINATSFYNDDGDIIDISTTSLHIASLYAEYGLWENIEATVSLPIFVSNSRENKDGSTSSLSGIGDLGLGLKVGIIQDQPFVLSASVSVSIPTGNADNSDNRLQTGDGEFNHSMDIHVGRSLHPLPIYFAGTVGYGNRSRNFSDEVHFSIEGGISFLKRLHFKAFLDGLFPLENGTKTHSNDFYSVFHNNTQYIAYGPELSVHMFEEKVGISAGADFASLGRNILASPSISLGAYFKF